MNKQPKDLWKGLSPSARKALTDRDYQERSLAERLSSSGAEAGELARRRSRQSRGQ